MKALRLFLQMLFVVANVAATVLFVLSAYSDHISPVSSMLFPYLGLAFPLFCMANLLFVAYWLFLGEWRFVLIGIIAFLICSGPVKHYFPWHGQSEEIPQEEVLKVLTYNVMAFGYKDHTKASPNKIIEYINDSDAYIVCLQEYAESRVRKGLTRKRILDALKKYPYRSILITHSTRIQNMGIAVFSKYPIKRSRRIKYKSKYNVSSVCEVQVGEKKVMLINNHLESFKLTMEDRSHYASFIQNLGAEGLDELKGAFHQKLGTAFRLRAIQAEAVAKTAEPWKDNYLLVCGDFNDTPISYAHRTIRNGLVDSFAESGRGMGVTYNQNYFWFRIDHILHSKKMKSFNCTVDEVDYSDHYPLWCYMQLR